MSSMLDFEPADLNSPLTSDLDTQHRQLLTAFTDAEYMDADPDKNNDFAGMARIVVENRSQPERISMHISESMSRSILINPQNIASSSLTRNALAGFLHKIKKQYEITSGTSTIVLLFADRTFIRIEISS